MTGISVRANIPVAKNNEGVEVFGLSGCSLWLSLWDPATERVQEEMHLKILQREI
jgi:hypothetical protein